MMIAAGARVRPHTSPHFVLSIPPKVGLCLFYFFFCVLAAFCQEPEIVKDIDIQGLQKISRDKVLYAIPAKIGKPYQPRKPGEIIHAIYDMGCFTEDIKVFRETVEGGINLTIIVHENPTIKDVEFVGNTKIPTQTLKSSCPVKAGDLIAPKTAVEIRSAIEKAYRAKGYTNTSVLVTAVDQGTTQAVIQVVVDEGEKLLVKDLIIRGNKSVSTSVLRFHLENKGSWLFIRNYFDSEAFQTDLEIVRMYYNTRGWLDARVRAGQFVHDPKSKWVCPVIEIEEGPRYRVGEVRPTGFTVFMREDLVEQFKPIQGRHYNLEQFQVAMQKVKDLYGDEGYINAEIYPDAETDPKSGLVHFDLRIEEHDRVLVREVKIKRNEYPAEEQSLIERMHGRLSPPVSNEVISREVLLKPGAPYRRFEEVATADRLRSLGIFDKVDIEAALTDDESKRDAILTVEEGNTGNLILGVGLSEWAGAYLHGGYVNRNLFGEARHLRTSFLLGTRDMQFRISYLDRYFNLPGQRLDKFFRRDPSGLVPFRFDLYRDALQLREYEETHTGATMMLTRVMRRGILTEDYGLRIEYVETEEDGYDNGQRWGYFGTRSKDGADKESDEDFGNYPVVSLLYNIEENTTDDWWWPTKGHILGGGVEAGFADGPLLKLSGRYAHYKTLSRYFIYALNAKMGWMPLGADQVGISERLFMGGANDLRGFAYRGAGPVDDKNDDLHIGGSTKLVVQNELRFPIYRQLKGFVFLDAGMLAENPFELDKPRVSSGVGLRFSTAKGREYGPRWKTGPTGIDLMRGFHIEVSLGAPLVKDSDDVGQYLHFILGSSF